MVILKSVKPEDLVVGDVLIGTPDYIWDGDEWTILKRTSDGIVDIKLTKIGNDSDRSTILGEKVKYSLNNKEYIVKYKRIKDTPLARELYPNAEVKGDYLEIN